MVMVDNCGQWKGQPKWEHVSHSDVQQWYAKDNRHNEFNTQGADFSLLTQFIFVNKAFAGSVFYLLVSITGFGYFCFKVFFADYCGVDLDGHAFGGQIDNAGDDTACFADSAFDPR